MDKTKKKCTRAKKKKQSKKASKALQLQNASEKTSSKHEKIAIVYTSLYSTCKRVQNILLAMIFFIFILARISCTPLRTLCPFHCCPGSFLLWHNPNHNLALSVMDRNEMEIHTHTHTLCKWNEEGKKTQCGFCASFYIPTILYLLATIITSTRAQYRGEKTCTALLRVWCEWITSSLINLFKRTLRFALLWCYTYTIVRRLRCCFSYVCVCVSRSSAHIAKPSELCKIF